MKGRAKAEQFAGEAYQIKIVGRHVLVTDSMKHYAEEKVAKIERFSDRILEVLVTMDIQKLEHIVDIVIKVDHIKIKSRASSTDMYASIDAAVGRIERQLRRYRKRISDHAAKSLTAVDMKVNVFRAPEEEQLLDVNLDIEAQNSRDLIEKYRPHEVVAEETRPLKTLTLDEAIMKMELSQDPFMIFRFEEDLKVRVIYRRKDGDYGVIQPE